jgi:hypothetical protein
MKQLAIKPLTETIESSGLMALACDKEESDLSSGLILLSTNSAGRSKTLNR